MSTMQNQRRHESTLEECASALTRDTEFEQQVAELIPMVDRQTWTHMHIQDEKDSCRRADCSDMALDLVAYRLISLDVVVAPTVANVCTDTTHLWGPIRVRCSAAGLSLISLRRDRPSDVLVMIQYDQS